MSAPAVPVVAPAQLYSIIIPVHDRASHLRECLRSIRKFGFGSSEIGGYEILVSDDGSADSESIRRIAEEFGARLFRSEQRRGSAAARNLAGQNALGTHLIFLDADVTVRSETLSELDGEFARGDIDAVIGSYDDKPGAPDTVSQFRNLLHAHAHQRSGPAVPTFWTGCGAITRERFLMSGGFSEAYTHPSIEDVEFGMRLHETHGRIKLARQVQVTHHKAWTLTSMVHTDLFRRAIPWTALLYRYSLPRELNFHMRDRIAAGLSAFALFSAIVAARYGLGWWTIFAVSLFGVAWLQAPALRYFAAARGARFAWTCFPLLLVYNLTCVAGALAGIVRAEHRRDRWFGPAVLSSLALITFLQRWGGAALGEFTTTGDEPRHFISGLMVYDYLVQMPWRNPVQWAVQYYLHYPLVGIGHWPPVFYLVEAFWWLLFPPSRQSGLALEACIALTAAVFFYRLVRELAPSWIALSTTLLLVACPVVQQSFDLIMADEFCLLCGVLLMTATSRLVRRPTFAAVICTAILVALGLWTKGSGACLIPVPAVALIIARRMGEIPFRWILWWSAAVLASLSWYAVQIGFLNMARLAGATGKIAWPIGLLPPLLGYGFFALSCAGIAVTWFRRRPAAVAATAMVLSTASVSFVLRAMREPRLWIAVVPAILILAVEFVECLRGLRLLRFAAPVLAAACLILFPFEVFRQQPEGFAASVAGLERPVRLMVASDWNSEGAWIAAIALSERRPSSFVIRSSQTLASAGLRDRDYRLLITTSAGVERRLDELRVDAVGLYPVPDSRMPPDYDVLSATMRDSASWQRQRSSGNLIVYRRVKPPVWPATPLHIDLPKFNLRFTE